MGKIILTSHGFNCRAGRQAIKRGLKSIYGDNFKQVLKDKTIVLFTMKDYGINKLLKEIAVSFGFLEKNILVWDDEISKEDRELRTTYDYCYCSEGNTFELAHMIRLTGGEQLILNSVKKGGNYIGSSAGAIMACSCIEFAEDFDRNFVRLCDMRGLNILPVELGRTTIIPHYTKRQFLRYCRNTPKWKLEQYDYIEYVPNTGVRIYDARKGEDIDGTDF